MPPLGSALCLFSYASVCVRDVCVCLLCWLNASWHLVARWSVRSPEASSTFFPVAPNKQRGGCNSCFVPLCRVRKCVGAAGELIFQLYLCNVAATLPSLYLRECVCVCGNSSEFACARGAAWLRLGFLLAFIILIGDDVACK